MRRDTGNVVIGKIVMIEGGAIPVVLLDDFGMYNWDAIDSLPDPVWRATRFLDGNGQQIVNARLYLLVGEINGVIRMPGGCNQVRLSPVMRNQFVLLDENGAVHFCTEAVVRDALMRGENLLTLPCTTIPHTLGEPPLDLRKVLPFQ